MKRITGAVLVIIVSILLASLVWVLFSMPEKPSPSSVSPVDYTYRIIKRYPHDSNAFTEGLVFENGKLYESTGSFGENEFSSLRNVNLENGNVLQKVLLPDQYFGEGLTIVNDTLLQLTWKSNIGFIYDKQTLRLLANFSYSSEGWGLTFTGNELIMSDGTSNLYFLDPITFQKIDQISVHDGDIPVKNINELEYINGDLYANIWLEEKIAIIDPQTGIVKGWIDLTGIYQSKNMNDVLNGIAYDPKTDRLFITGKNWPNLYQIVITKK